MIVSHSLRYCYVSCRKCATNTMYKVLKENFDGKHFGGFHERNVRTYSNPEYFHWTIVRNPYARTISIWASTTQRGKDRYGIRKSIVEMGGNPDEFKDFVKLLESSDLKSRDPWLLRTQHRWLNTVKFDKILKMENLTKSFAELPFVKSEVELPFENNTHTVRRDFKEYLNNYTMDCIEKWAQKDFQEYGYKVGDIEC